MELRRRKEKKQIKTRAEGKKVSRSSPILGVSAVSAGARRVGSGRACPEGKREDPPGAKPCRRRQGRQRRKEKRLGPCAAAALGRRLQTPKGPLTILTGLSCGDRPGLAPEGHGR